MGRSVSTPHNATVVAYRSIEVESWEDTDEDGDTITVEPTDMDHQDAFDYMVEDLQEYARTLWPSLSKCDSWIGREDHALLENEHCYMGISEYCGLVATWIVPKTDELANGWGEDASRANLCDNWVAQIEAKFLATYGNLRKLGTFSNGESVFQNTEPTDMKKVA